ncbi:MAG: hypothetical protein HYU80_00725 [Candidatus Blackburnbacteria bacterium]|nr:hypothetical protein [Candidatus Blackburnbacteria bacterium]
MSKIIESGTIQNPTIDTLSKIANALDAKVDDLIKKQYESSSNIIFKNKN